MKLREGWMGCSIGLLISLFVHYAHYSRNEGRLVNFQTALTKVKKKKKELFVRLEKKMVH
jgi:hypothetical protein